ADDPVCDAFDAEVQRLLDARWLARLACVAGQVQPGGSRGLEGGSMRRRRVAGLVTGKVETDDAASCERAGSPRERDVLLRRVMAHRAHDRDRRDGASI